MKKLLSKLGFAPIRMFVLSIITGVCCGFGAVFFRELIGFFHNLFFAGDFSFLYDANVHTPNHWGAWIILAPIIGAVGVVFLVKNFAPEAKGHGVPEVMEAIYFNKGVIRPVVALIKSLASALSIGSGGSVGREGPIIQIGAAFGSWLGTFLKIPPWQRITLIAAGAGAGVAATFNTPIGGVLFATEIILPEVSARTLVPVVTATAASSYVGQRFFGTNPSFVIPAFEGTYFHLARPAVLLAYVFLGVLAGLVSWLFIRSIYAFEDLFDGIVKRNDYFRHILGMAIVGITVYGFMAFTGRYYVEGVGYAAIQDILNGSLKMWPLIICLFVAKLLVTSLTLGSGGSGGIFSPSLFLGAALGGVYGNVLTKLFPSIGINSAAFAVVGMAGVVGGATGAAVTAIVMVFEMTLDYSVVVPMTIVVAISYGLRTLLTPQSIYTLKLFRRGHDLPDAFQANIHVMKRAGEVMDRNFVSLTAEKGLGDLTDRLAKTPVPACFVIMNHDRVVGVIPLIDVAGMMNDSSKRDLPLGELCSRAFTLISASERLSEIIPQLTHRTSTFLLVGVKSPEGDRVVGYITPSQVAESFMAASEVFSSGT